MYSNTVLASLQTDLQRFICFVTVDGAPEIFSLSHYLSGIDMHYFTFIFYVSACGAVRLTEGLDSMAQPVVAQAILFIVAPVMLGSCCPQKLILDSLDGFF